MIVSSDEIAKVRKLVGEEAWEVFSRSVPCPIEGTVTPEEVALLASVTYDNVLSQHSFVARALREPCESCGKSSEVPCGEVPHYIGALSAFGSKWSTWTVCVSRMCAALGCLDLLPLFAPQAVLRVPDDRVVLDQRANSIIALNTRPLVVEPGKTARISEHSSGRVFRPDRLLISAHGWVIEDLAIGNRSQFRIPYVVPNSGGAIGHKAPGPVPVELFSSSVTGATLMLDDVDVGMDVVVHATRSAAASSSEFYGCLVGQRELDRRVAVMPRGPETPTGK